MSNVLEFTDILKYSTSETGVKAVVSSSAMDSDGDVIAGWDFKKFKERPIMLADHAGYSIEAQIGIWKNLRIVGSGPDRQLLADGDYFTDGDESLPHIKMAKVAKDLANRGVAAFSIRGRATKGVVWGREKIQYASDVPDWVKELKPRAYVPEIRIVEISQVGIPANQDAVQRSAGGVETLEDYALREAIKSLNQVIRRY